MIQKRNEILKKLNSETGASLSVALLFFVVCAVLSSIIIASAYSATGRLAGLAENDQDYYAVTSATQVIKNQMDDQTVYIQEVYEKNTEPSGTLQWKLKDAETKIYTVADTGIVTLADGAQVKEETGVVGKQLLSFYKTYLNSSSITNKYQTLLSNIAENNTSKTDLSTNLKITISSNCIRDEKLSVDAKMSIKNDSTLDFEIQKLAEAANGASVITQQAHVRYIPEITTKYIVQENISYKITTVSYGKGSVSKS